MPKYIILASIIVLCGLLTALWFLSDGGNKTQNTEGYYEKLSNSGKEFTVAYQDSLEEIIDDTGIEGALTILEIGEKDGHINLENCHPLTHLVGHEAQRRNVANLNELVGEYGMGCQKAFQHGVEAQIALEEGNLTDLSNKLTDACRVFQKFNGGSTCYHGAGHAFYQRSDNPKVALGFCDAIKDDDQESIDDCYRGIFSELGNQVLGIDGETGLAIPGPKKELEDNMRPLLHCMQYDQHYQEACMSQLTKVAAMHASSGRDYSPCLIDEYNGLAKSTCIKIYAAMTVRNELGYQDTLEVPDIIFSLDPDFQEAYILGVLDTLIGFTQNGNIKDWKSICNQFREDLSDYCTDEFSDNLGHL